MMTSDVPTAWAMDKPRKIVSAGTMRKPPPTPSSPVRNPIPKPTAKDLVRQPRVKDFPPVSQPPAVSLVRESMRMPAATMMTAKASSSMSSFRSRPAAAPAHAAGMPAAPTSSAMRQLIPVRMRGITAAMEEAPTTSREVGIASWVLSPTP